MTRFSGVIGFGFTEKTAPGVWKDEFEERHVYGEVKRDTRRLENGTSVNDNINTNNVIEIIGDDYIFDNFLNIKYVSWMGSLWKISNVDVQRPRLILTIGGIYNGDSPRTE